MVSEQLAGALIFLSELRRGRKQEEEDEILLRSAKGLRKGGNYMLVCGRTLSRKLNHKSLNIQGSEEKNSPKYANTWKGPCTGRKRCMDIP